MNKIFGNCDSGIESIIDNSNSGWDDKSRLNSMNTIIGKEICNESFINKIDTAFNNKAQVNHNAKDYDEHKMANNDMNINSYNMARINSIIANHHDLQLFLSNTVKVDAIFNNSTITDSIKKFGSLSITQSVAYKWKPQFDTFNGQYISVSNDGLTLKSQATIEPGQSSQLACNKNYCQCVARKHVVKDGKITFSLDVHSTAGDRHNDYGIGVTFENIQSTSSILNNGSVHMYCGSDGVIYSTLESTADGIRNDLCGFEQEATGEMTQADWTWGAGDTVKVQLDYSTWTIEYYKNDVKVNNQSYQIIPNKTYYPIVQCCACAGQHYQVV